MPQLIRYVFGHFTYSTMIIRPTLSFLVALYLSRRPWVLHWLQMLAEAETVLLEDKQCEGCYELNSQGRSED